MNNYYVWATDEKVCCIVCLGKNLPYTQAKKIQDEYNGKQYSAYRYAENGTIQQYRRQQNFVADLYSQKIAKQIHHIPVSVLANF